MNDPAPAGAAGPLVVRGIDVPRFFYGTAWKEDRTRSLTALALVAGFRGVDTANQRRHYVEAAVGEAVSEAIGAGRVRREELFVQTKFTYVHGQDHRLPYDPRADLATQVNQSFASSLEHLRTDRLDSYVLHGPVSGYGWAAEDAEVWRTMRALKDAGRVRLLGVSNVSARHLSGLCDSGAELPAFVQNRCYARTGWDRRVRDFCQERGIVYQGFSLLTANPEVLSHPVVCAMAASREATPAQIVFRFAQQIGMIPLTGTSSRSHMEQDLACAGFDLTSEELQEIESLES
jgi:diketogulonate reductase-like aldo/keto reductase